MDSNFIKQKAKEVGFDLCGIAKPHVLKEFAPPYKDWLEKKFHANQDYLKRNFEKKINPFEVYPKLKSIIVVAKNYYPQELQQSKIGKISKYAHGKDYHFYMKDRLRSLLALMKTENNRTKAKLLVDSGNAFEKYWAQKAGLGFIAKNTLLTTKEFGSYQFLGLMYSNLDLEFDTPYHDEHCGECQICLKACPNGAIHNNRTLDCNKCIAYQTVESKVKDSSLKYANWAYGCDICQDVCPLNKHKRATEESFFQTKQEIRDYNSEQWGSITQTEFDSIFEDSAIHRIGLDKFKKNFE